MSNIQDEKRTADIAEAERLVPSNACGKSGANDQRVVRRSELHRIIPLSDTTIHELEKRGEAPRRFNLTPRCVVWDLAEIHAWLEARRGASGAGKIKRAPCPDVRLRRRRRVGVKCGDE